jgi:hypothetical protein
MGEEEGPASALLGCRTAAVRAHVQAHVTESQRRAPWEQLRSGTPTCFGAEEASVARLKALPLLVMVPSSVDAGQDAYLQPRHAASGARMPALMLGQWPRAGSRPVRWRSCSGWSCVALPAGMPGAHLPPATDAALVRQEAGSSRGVIASLTSFVSLTSQNDSTRSSRSCGSTDHRPGQAAVAWAGRCRAAAPAKGSAGRRPHRHTRPHLVHGQRLGPRAAHSHHVTPGIVHDGKLLLLRAWPDAMAMCWL